MVVCVCMWYVVYVCAYGGGGCVFVCMWCAVGVCAYGGVCVCVCACGVWYVVRVCACVHTRHALVSLERKNECFGKGGRQRSA